MAQYVDYDYYFTMFRGKITLEEFEQFVGKAGAFVDMITHNRIGKDNPLDAVKDAVCAVCDVISEDAKRFSMTDGKEVKSESNDGYSISYVTESKEGQVREELLQRKMYCAARMYLLHTGLLYAGV